MPFCSLIAHFFRAELYFIGWMYHGLYLHAVGCFQALAMMNKAAINICVQVFVRHKVFHSFG